MTTRADDLPAAAGGADAPGEPTRRRRWAAPSVAGLLQAPLVVGAVALLVGLAVRLWQARGRAPLVWQDSLDYIAASRLPWFGLARWAGLRPVLTPLLLAAVGHRGGVYQQVQQVLAGICWAVLAGVVAATLAPGWRRWAAAAAVVALSVTTEVTMWEQSVLSESPALSLLALVAAAAVALGRGLTGRRAVALLAAVAAWAAVRDSNATVVLLATTGLAVGVAVRRPARWRLLLALVGGLVAIGGAVVVSAAHGHRDAQPIEHILAVRVLPFPDRRQWFADHGMPEADRLALLAPVRDPGMAPYVAVPPSTELAAWRRWIRSHGRSTLIEWSLAHPAYLVGEPFRSPERVFNNGGGRLDIYRPDDFRALPLGSWPWHRATWWVVGGAGGLVAVAGWRRTLSSPLALVGAALVATAAPHAALVWHSDGMESARHLVVPGLQLRIGVVLLLAAALASPTTRRAEAAAPAVEA